MSLSLSAPAHADGGALLLYDKSGPYALAVFTSPTPLRAGAVDVSVLVQDARGNAVPDAVVVVRLQAGEQKLAAPATFELATNKLFRAAHFDLPAGRWDVTVEVTGSQGPATARTAVEVGEALTPALGMWPWFAWPALAVLAFAVHQVRVRRRAAPH